jgi:PDZ domain
MLRLLLLMVAILASSLSAAAESRETSSNIGILRDINGNSVSVGTSSIGTTHEITLFATDKLTINRIYVRLSVEDFKKLLELLKETNTELTKVGAGESTTTVETTTTIGKFFTSNQAYLAAVLTSHGTKREALLYISDEPGVNYLGFSMSPKDIQKLFALLGNAATELSRGGTQPEIDNKAPNMSAPSSSSKGKAVFGVNFIDLPPSIALGLHRENMKGALIVAVNPGSVSDKAGIKVGDVIYEFDGKPIEKIVDLQKAVSETDVGRKVLVKLLRGEKDLNVDAQF